MDQFALECKCEQPTEALGIILIDLTLRKKGDKVSKHHVYHSTSLGCSRKAAPGKHFVNILATLVAVSSLATRITPPQSLHASDDN